MSWVIVETQEGMIERVSQSYPPATVVTIDWDDMASAGWDYARERLDEIRNLSPGRPLDASAAPIVNRIAVAYPDQYKDWAGN